MRGARGDCAWNRRSHWTMCADQMSRFCLRTEVFQQTRVPQNLPELPIWPTQTTSVVLNEATRIQRRATSPDASDLARGCQDVHRLDDMTPLSCRVSKMRFPGEEGLLQIQGSVQVLFRHGQARSHGHDKEAKGLERGGVRSLKQSKSSALEGLERCLTVHELLR